MIWKSVQRFSEKIMPKQRGKRDESYRALVPEFLLAPDLKLPLDGLDIGKRRQSGFVAEALNLIGRSGARKLEMVGPVFFGMGEIGIDIGAVEDGAGRRRTAPFSSYQSRPCSPMVTPPMRQPRLFR